MRPASSTDDFDVIAENEPQESWDPGVDEPMTWPDASPDSSTVRIDRNDELGNVVGYSLISETEWDTTVESYDLGDNLIGRTYTNISGSSHSYTWEPSLEADGKIIGATATYASSEGSFSDSLVQIHDAEGNLLSSSYRNSHGDWATSTRVTPPEELIGPAPLSYALQTTGAWGDGITYQRTELFDIHGNLVRSESAYSDGSSEDYRIMPIASEDGVVEGYTGTWTWIDINGYTSSWSNHFDSQLNSIQTYSHTATTELACLTFEPEISICTFPVPEVHVDPIPDEHVNPVDIELDDSGDHAQYQESQHISNPLRIDRNDEFGNVIGYSLTTETEWYTLVENYDLDNNLISGTYTDLDGYFYSYSSTWESIFDSDGLLAGQRHLASFSDGSYSDSRVEIYDTDGNLLSSSYSSSDGDWENTTRTSPPELSIGPAPLSHALTTSGAWADGTTYERLELYDINGQLVHAENIYSDGSSQHYIIEPFFREDGSIEGYQGTWTCTYQNGEISSFIETFDSNLNPIFLPVICPMPTPLPTPSESDGEDGISLDHCFAYPKSFPVLYSTNSTIEPQMAYAFRGFSPMDESAETDQPLVAAHEAPVALGEAEPFTTPEEEGVDWTADEAVNWNLISTSTPAGTLATTASIEPFITSEFLDLKLNVREYQNATHGKLLGGLDLILRGNKHTNVLVGNTGNNRIAGGRGKDLVTGGGGSDQFTFRNRRHSIDTITDFNADEDKFLLKGNDFGDLFTSRGLRKEAIGSSLSFDQNTGYLLYSPNGDGANPRPIKLALLPGLEASDFSADLFLFG